VPPAPPLTHISPQTSLHRRIWITPRDPSLDLSRPNTRSA
jgi:hypothetical protein